MASDDFDHGKHRKVFAAGMFEGLRKAGIKNPEEFMSQKAIQSAERNLTGMNLKVMQSVPINELWAVKAICGELMRMKVGHDHGQVMRSLLHLKEIGLIREPEPGLFVRAQIKPQKDAHGSANLELVPASRAPMIPASKPVFTIPKAAPEVSSADPFERISRVATKAKRLAEEVAELAGMVEEIGLDCEARIEQTQKDAADAIEWRAQMKRLMGS